MTLEQICHNISEYVKFNGYYPDCIEFSSLLATDILQKLNLSQKSDRILSNKAMSKKIREAIKIKTGLWIKIKVTGDVLAIA